MLEKKERPEPRGNAAGAKTKIDDDAQQSYAKPHPESNHVGTYESPLVLRLRADLAQVFNLIGGHPVGLLDPAEAGEIAREFALQIGAEVRP